MDVSYLIKKEGLRRGLSPRTIHTYCSCVKRFLNYTNKEVKRITKKDVTDYIDKILENETKVVWILREEDNELNRLHYRKNRDDPNRFANN